LKKTAYYNEFDPMAAAWLRELIVAPLAAEFIKAFMETLP